MDQGETTSSIGFLSSDILNHNTGPWTMIVLTMALFGCVALRGEIATRLFQFLSMYPLIIVVNLLAVYTFRSIELVLEFFSSS